MTPTRRNTRNPRLLIDPDAIASHLEELDDNPPCPACRDAVIPVAADTVAALIEAIRLWNALHLARLESANHLAVIHAALRAQAEGEPDPLAYLRDELTAQDAPGRPA